MKAASDVWLSKVLRKVQLKLDAKAASDHNHDSEYTYGIKRSLTSEIMPELTLTYETPDVDEKLYLVQIAAPLSDIECCTTVLVDWKLLTYEMTGFGVDCGDGYARGILTAVKVDGGKVRFVISTTGGNATLYIKRVIGYQ